MKRKFESCTSIGLYRKCPWAYWAKYGLGLPDPSGPEAAFGTEYHEAVYATWHTRIAEHKDERIRRMLACLYADPRVAALPKVKLVHGVTCEKKVITEVAGVTIMGFIDIDLREYGVEFPIDLKSSSKKIDSKKLSEIRQHKHYPLALGCDEFLYLLVTTPKMQKDKQPISLARQLEWTPELQWKKLVTGENEKVSWEDEVADTTFRIELDQFKPKPQILCDWCPFKAQCPAWQ